MNKFTKIVATIGPSSDSEEKLAELINAGVNVIRFNMKHADIEWHRAHITKLRKVTNELSANVGALIDLQGPEIRVETPNKQDINLKKGDTLYFTDRPNIPNSVYVPNGLPTETLKAGDELLVDDGFNEFVITKKTSAGVYAQAVDDCVVQNHKGLNLPNKHIDLPSLTKGDLKRLDMASVVGVEFIALSFCRSKKDLDKLKSEMAKRNLKAMVIAKVESREAVNNIDEIIENADGVMVARGDLGVEVPYEELSFWQTEIIKKCRLKNKSVIVATQMLESMKSSPRPTRAEVTDVANAVLQGTDAVMLSGETASGKFPVKAVQAMAKIAKFNEGRASLVEKNITAIQDTELVVDAANVMLQVGHGPNIDAIIVFTETGFTARVISSYRPNIPVIAVSDVESTVRELTLSYGITAVLADFPSGLFTKPSKIISGLVKKHLVKKGDTVLIIHGEHWKKAGQTNSVGLHRI